MMNLKEESAYRRHKTNATTLIITLIVVGLLLTFWLPFSAVVVGTATVLFFTSQFLYARGRDIRAILYPYDKDTNDI